MEGGSERSSRPRPTFTATETRSPPQHHAVYLRTRLQAPFDGEHRLRYDMQDDAAQRRRSREPVLPGADARDRFKGPMPAWCGGFSPRVGLPTTSRVRPQRVRVVYATYYGQLSPGQLSSRSPSLVRCSSAIPGRRHNDGFIQAAEVNTTGRREQEHGV